MRSSILLGIARAVVPVTALFALYLLLRGHDAPGGGFIAGLVTSAAVILQALASGVGRVRAAVRRMARPFIWMGLAASIASGLIAIAMGETFLTHQRATAALGRHVAVTASTTLLFDIGVYFVVLGTTTALLDLFAESP